MMTQRPLFACSVVALIATLGSGILIACSSSDAPSAEDLAGETYEQGQEVEAKYPGNGKVKKGKIRELYGRVALIDFNNRRRHWVKVKELEPPGAVQPAPEGDACAFEKNDRVLAPRSKSGRTVSGKILSSMNPGTVERTYGKMAEIRFSDNGLDWAYCEKMKVNDKPDPKPTPPGGDAQSGNTEVCAFRPDVNKYVVCQTFAAGKCISGSRTCKPRSKCVYRPEEGKYVQCTTFSNGKCRSGTRACEPPGKCVFSAKKQKHIRCSTFTKGKCISGSAACEPS